MIFKIALLILCWFKKEIWNKDINSLCKSDEKNFRKQQYIVEQLTIKANLVPSKTSIAENIRSISELF